MDPLQPYLFAISPLGFLLSFHFVSFWKQLVAVNFSKENEIRQETST